MHSIPQLRDKVSELFDTRNYLSTPNELYEPIQYTLSQGGKRLRPLLSLISCSMFGGNLSEVENAAIGLEIFHNFTLLHDDIMDQSPMRRGMPSVYTKWDTNTAILSGDTMFVLAYDYVIKTNPEILYNTLVLFNQTAREVCEGQQYDMNFENLLHTNIEEYMEMIRLKTAVLIAAALKMGALAARASQYDQDAIYDFGILIGIAFQLRDDFLDAFGNQAVFGKPIGNDIVTNKKTFLYLKAFEKANPAQKNQLIQAFAMTDSQQKVKQVLEIYESLQIRHETDNIILELHRQALEILNKINISQENRNSILPFLHKLVGREV
jgi:geranylgeranyl diphosphate synthase type II